MPFSAIGKWLAPHHERARNLSDKRKTVCLSSMLVDLVMLRRSGRKRPREDVLADIPLRGDLSICTRHGVLQAALLPDKRLPDDMPVLEECRVTRLCGQSFVLVGFEQVDLRRAGHARYCQAWWCRLAGTHAMSVSAPAPDKREPVPA